MNTRRDQRDRAIGSSGRRSGAARTVDTVAAEDVKIEIIRRCRTMMCIDACTLYGRVPVVVRIGKTRLRTACTGVLIAGRVHIEGSLFASEILHIIGSAGLAGIDRDRAAVERRARTGLKVVVFEDLFA